MAKKFYGYSSNGISVFPSSPTRGNIYALGLYDNVLYGGVTKPFIYYWRIYSSPYYYWGFISDRNATARPRFQIGNQYDTSNEYTQNIFAVDSGSALDTLLSGFAPSIPHSYITGKYRFNNIIETLLNYTFNSAISNDSNKHISCPINFVLENENYIGFIFKYGDGYSNLTATSITLVKDDDTFNTYTLTQFTEAFSTKKIDFGDVEQEIPTVIYNWLTSQTEQLYPYVYTIKAPDGTTLAKGEELPPIRNVTLSTVGNKVTMVLTGSNSRQYTLTWSHTVPEGKIFLGLGYAATEKRASIPSGTTTAVTWDSDITVYEIYGKYIPPATTFTITLYQNTAENSRVDKTNYLTSVGSINGALRAECSILRPSIIIAQDTLPTFNYVYIEAFGRYYFVTGITSVNFGLWRIELNTDVLMSYKEGVKALTAIIARQENDYNDNLIDTEIPTEKEPTVAYQEIPNSVLTTQEDSDTHSFVITVVGA